MILIVQSLWNESVTRALAESAEKFFQEHDIPTERIQVPGALEIPLAIQWGFQKKNYKGAVACGCVIKGDTYHFELVTQDSSRALMDISLRFSRPIGHSILACQTPEQAKARLDKGREGAEAVFQMLKLKNEKFKEEST